MCGVSNIFTFVGSYINHIYSLLFYNIQTLILKMLKIASHKSDFDHQLILIDFFCNRSFVSKFEVQNLSTCCTQLNFVNCYKNIMNYYNIRL